MIFSGFLRQKIYLSYYSPLSQEIAALRQLEKGS
jgi:hypothetical protein